MIRLLIVDDIAQVRQGLRTVLPLAAEAAGLQIEIVGEAKDGAQAVELAAGLCPDAILMDLEMPVMDGCTAARLIRQQQPTVRLVALTVHTSPEVCATALAAGFDDFFEKGTSAHSLVEGIARWNDPPTPVF